MGGKWGEGEMGRGIGRRGGGNGSGEEVTLCVTVCAAARKILCSTGGEAPAYEDFAHWGGHSGGLGGCGGCGLGEGEECGDEREEGGEDVESHGLLGEVNGSSWDEDDLGCR